MSLACKSLEAGPPLWEMSYLTQEGITLVDKCFWAVAAVPILKFEAGKQTVAPIKSEENHTPLSAQAVAFSLPNCYKSSFLVVKRCDGFM